MPYEIDVLAIGDKKSGDAICDRYGTPQTDDAIHLIDCGLCRYTHRPEGRKMKVQ